MDINLKKVKMLALKHKRITLLLFVAILAISTFLGFQFTKKVITITDEKNEIVIKSWGKLSVKDALISEGIYLAEEDEVEPSLNSYVKNGDEIVVKRAIPVTIKADGLEYKFQTTERKVEDIIIEVGLKIGDIDIVTPNKSEEIDFNNIEDINIIRVSEELMTQNQVITYNTVVKNNNSMDAGITKTVQKGINGERIVTEKVTYYDSKEYSREVVQDEIIKEPVNKVNEIGTNIFVATSRGSTKFVKAIYVTATGYCPCSKCVGSYDGNRTASGAKTTQYKTVAASKNFSFGTEFYIPYFKNAPNSGIFVVQDRGGAIKGNKIDIFFNTHKDALKFGRRTLKIYVLD